MKVKSLLISILVLGMVGCGAIIHGTTQDVNVMAPHDAVVQVGDKVVQGGASVRLSRDRSHSVIMTKNGKTTPCGQITNSISGGILIADILLFPLGFIIDAVTGAWYNLEPTQVMCMN